MYGLLSMSIDDFSHVAQHAKTNGHVLITIGFLHFGDNKTSTYNINGYKSSRYIIIQIVGP